MNQLVRFTKHKLEPAESRLLVAALHLKAPNFLDGCARDRLFWGSRIILVK
jgi:hypothetical protein